ncbi:MAG: matrixin family metalloprotease [Ferruginibacter sp.]
MANKQPKIEKNEDKINDAFRMSKADKPSAEEEFQVHIIAPGIICDTDSRGHVTPQGRSPFEIVVDASEGFIPLWVKNTTLRWRFRKRSLSGFESPALAMEEIRKLFGEALLAWGDAAPVRFTEDDDVWDFEIVVKPADSCNPQGCVLASAFFPDAGRHEFVLYPKMFTQSRKEQVDTFIHETGHVFGLRHFFANISEIQFPSEIFGTHSKFSIMNYGILSELTDNDKSDLKRLYLLVWSGALTAINGTPIRLVKPYNTLASTSDGILTFGQVSTPIQPQASVAYISRM